MSISSLSSFESTIFRVVVESDPSISEVSAIDRHSSRYFDFSWSHKSTVNIGGNASVINSTQWFPLWYIKNYVKWDSHEIANKTDYPEMARSGDWSAIRDSSSDVIWGIFSDAIHNIIKR